MFISKNVTAYIHIVLKPEKRSDKERLNLFY